MIPEDESLIRNPAKHRAYLAMLAARDIANRCVEHANDLRASLAEDAAELFDQAAAAGLPDE